MQNRAMFCIDVISMQITAGEELHDIRNGNWRSLKYSKVHIRLSNPSCSWSHWSFG